MIIQHTTLLHQLKNQLDKAHLHAKIIFVPYQENKNISHCATLLNYFPTIFTFLPLKILHIWVSVFNTVTLVFVIFRGIRSRENREKYSSEWARFMCTQNHLLAATDCMQINFSGKTSSVRRKNRYESTVFNTIAHSASSSQCLYWTLVLPFLKVI